MTRAAYLEHLFDGFAREAANAVRDGEAGGLELNSVVLKTDSGSWVLSSYLRHVPDCFTANMIPDLICVRTDGG